METGLDWVVGDRIALGPTSYAYNASEDNFVTAYDIETGKTSLATELLFYHWGASDSTGDDYNGVDMRAEVILLSRNIVIVGGDEVGGQIYTGEIMEFMGGQIH